jgi:broad specificity phosphatase PhoE
VSVKITFFAHGTTTDNEKDISSGWSDVELSTLGRQQQVALKEQIKDRKFAVVFCSDLKRAIQSAELTFGGEVEIISDKRLRECNYGEMNGQPTSLVQPLEEDCVVSPFLGGESYEDVKARTLDFLESLRLRWDGETVAIIGHKGTQLALEVLLNNKTWEQAFAEDWRKTKAWQPGWDYMLE